MSHAAALAMPQPGNSGSQSTVATPEGSVVIIGANGSGKTRLGAWFEITSGQQGMVRRIGAQKTLTFPNSVSPTSLQDAIGALDIGIDAARYAKSKDAYAQNPITYRKSNKWQGKPETALVDDYRALLILLVSEQYEVSLDYTLQAKNQTVYTTPPSTKLDQVKRIWEQVLPHRELVLKASTVQVQPTGASAKLYEASDMSDGERVSFYLIGQCLAAPTNAILVIDEPEIHLHRVIQARLWDAIEQARPDCLFVYLTHDLDFAASRTKAKKLWIRSFDGQSWDWQEVPSEAEGLPEEVLLAVLGSRRPVLFTEGDRGGTEQALFTHLYPGWTIMPRGGCEQVIQATQAFRALRHLHGIDSHGIVDLDYRSAQEKASLAAVGVHALDVQEIENLLLIEPVLQLVASHLHTNSLVVDTPAEIVRKVKEFAFTTLSRDKDLLASRKTAWALEQQLHKIDRSVVGIAALEGVRARATQFDVAATYTAFAQEIDRIVAVQDYAALLHLYNNKGLARQVGRFFSVPSYLELVKRLISNPSGAPLIAALRAAAPQLPAVTAGAPTTVTAAAPLGA